MNMMCMTCLSSMCSPSPLGYTCHTLALDVTYTLSTEVRIGLPVLVAGVMVDVLHGSRVVMFLCCLGHCCSVTADVAL